MPHDFVGVFDSNIEKFIVYCISATKNYYNLKKRHTFQASVTRKCTSLSNSSAVFQQNPLKLPIKKLNL